VSHILVCVDTNTGRMGVDFAGATPFWRAPTRSTSTRSPLVRYGADPSIRHDIRRASPRPDPSGLNSIATGGPHVPAFHAATASATTSRVAQSTGTCPRADARRK